MSPPSSMLKLNAEQLQAVEHGEGPLLVIAGPGSGKTCVITQRIVHLLGAVPGSEPRLGPRNILALTFTEKAAGEMQARVKQALPALEESPRISTFHAFCYHLSRQRHFNRSLLDSRRLIEGAAGSSLGRLISEAVRLLDRDPEMLDRCRQQYRYVLVDEFQDTNFAQVELLRRLVAAPFNITAVGDDDQAIYRFRGASHGAFQMFDDAFPGHRAVYLERNYRSTKKILRAAGVVISKNDRYENKKGLKTEIPEGPGVYLA